MKQKVVLIFMYILLTVVAGFVGVYWLSLFVFDDIINHYCYGILRYVFLLIIVAGIILPILKYRKYKQKWILPLVLIIITLVTPVFNNGILKFVQDNLEIYSQEKWENNEYLRIYMINDLETNYVIKGRNQEYVKSLLGEPDLVSGDNSQYFEYYAGVGFMETIMYYVRFENGIVVETGTQNH